MNPDPVRVASSYLAADAAVDGLYVELLRLWKREFPRGRGYPGRRALEFDVREVFRVGDPLESVDPYEEESAALEAKWVRGLLRVMKPVMDRSKLVRRYEFESSGEDFTFRVELR